MKPSVLKEVSVTLQMAPEMELIACEKASAVARSMGMSQDKIDEVKLAVIEACLNALEHSKAQPREFQITFERCAGDGLPHAQSLDGKSNPALISINGNRKG